MLVRANPLAMNTKLTLTIEQTVIEQANIYAKKKGQSLSDMVENYLRSVSHTKEQDFEEMAVQTCDDFVRLVQTRK